MVAVEIAAIMSNLEPNRCRLVESCLSCTSVDFMTYMLEDLLDAATCISVQYLFNFVLIKIGDGFIFLHQPGSSLLSTRCGSSLYAELTTRWVIRHCSVQVLGLIPIHDKAASGHFILLELWLSDAIQSHEKRTILQKHWEAGHFVKIRSCLARLEFPEAPFSLIDKNNQSSGRRSVLQGKENVDTNPAVTVHHNATDIFFRHLILHC
jgi:hypothetical protein